MKVVLGSVIGVQIVLYRIFGLLLLSTIFGSSRVFFLLLLSTRASLSPVYAIIMGVGLERTLIYA